MKLADKEFGFYWKIIKIPLAVLVGWSLIGLIVALINYSVYIQIFSNISGWIITIAVFGFIGYTTAKDYKGANKHSFFAGGSAGVIYGFIGAIFGIIMINLIPEFSVAAIAQSIEQGADPAMIEKFMKIGSFFGIITGPLFSGVIGAVISWIGGLLGKKI